MMRAFWRRKIAGPALDMLRQGITPEKLALSLSLGITLGVTPVLGATSLLCFLAAALLRLNLPAIQLVNYLVYPLQFALLVPFLRLGGWLFGNEAAGMPLGEMLQLARDDFWGAVALLGPATLQALGAWALSAAAATVVLYFALAALLRRLARSLKRGERG